jgi:hypothetical protein
MRFKTVIKLVADARDKNEAIDLVDDYLAGNIVTGVDMKCATKPVHSPVTIVGVYALVLAVTAGVILLSHIKHPQNMLQTVPGVSAVQPPLKTSNIANKSPEFKDKWQERQTKEALSQITR